MAPLNLNGDGDAAVKVTIRFVNGAVTVGFQGTRARCLPSLPTTAASRPLLGLDLIDLAGNALYRRHYTPPGHVEIPGIRPRQVTLPANHLQIMVVLIPHLPGAKGIQFYAGPNIWMSREIPGAL